MNKTPCPECGGEHDFSGARSDCVHFWKQRAVMLADLMEWGRALLYNATPNEKYLDEANAQKWCEGFGKWVAQSYAIPALSNDWSCAKQLHDWLNEGTYRTVMHRHTGAFRVVDESERKRIDADTIPLLCDALLDWENMPKYIVDIDEIEPPMRGNYEK